MILLHTIFENYCKHFNELDYTFFKSNARYKKNFINLSHLNQHKPIAISKLYNYIHKSSNKFLQNYSDYKFISRNFWNEFINQYWQETIFISNSNYLSESYINKLKNKNLSIYKKNDYKNFLSEFSRDLINGKIPIEFNSNINSRQKVTSSLITYNNNTYVKFIWKKGINWYIVGLYLKYLSIVKQILNPIKILNFKRIELNSLPIFAISNQYNQIIMSESADQLILQKDLWHSLYNWYNAFLVKKIYTGLLFINPKDALEYKEYIISKYLKANYSNNLKFFIGHLNFYYKLLYSSKKNTEFRLIPDLKEISDLLSKYQYYKNINFDKQQRYGNNYFQGQPIYIIKPILVKNKNTNKKDYINYFYNMPKRNAFIKCKAIFLNYDTAITAWNKFKLEHSYYKLPKKPFIHVSNLEYFLKISNDYDKDNYFVFIPSIQTYNFIKKDKQVKDMNLVKYFCINKSIYIKSLFKRIVWSLSSRQPVNW
uniref:Ycf80 n=1 Tax=Apoglossum ruscifolium TaxID=167976 RepID=A0A4D6WLE3_9FLOR|nr:hypothetical protein [Apoglossum ruscifolium]